ncbi:hypothetical protein ACE1SV_69630 [Streptomyces sennicomposti]
MAAAAGEAVSRPAERVSAATETVVATVRAERVAGRDLAMRRPFTWGVADLQCRPTPFNPRNVVRRHRSLIKP